jgi:hypothetical protein
VASLACVLATAAVAIAWSQDGAQGVPWLRLFTVIVSGPISGIGGSAQAGQWGSAAFWGILAILPIGLIATYFWNGKRSLLASGLGSWLLLGLLLLTAVSI